MRPRFRVPAALTAIALCTVGVTGVATAAPSAAPGYLETCLGASHKLSVLMLVDESKSLKEIRKGSDKSPGNDSLDVRVPALTSVVRVLNSAVEASASSVQGGRAPLEVSIAIAGFGDGYNLRLPFTALNDRTVEQVADALKNQADRDTDLRTRYDVALQQSLREFDDHSAVGDDCRLLIWFSDGQHDSNNEPGYSTGEKDEIEKVLCGSNGIVDGLRAGKVTIVAAGLNPNEKELGLMRLIASGGSGYRSDERSGRAGRVSVAVDRCGETMPDGQFALAQDADDIVDSLFEVLVSVPGIPDPGNPLASPTPGQPDQYSTAVPGGQQFYSQVFTVDDSVAAFQILVERPSEAVSVVLTTPEVQDMVVLNGEGPSSDLTKNVVESTVVTARKAQVSVTRKKESPIRGEWRIGFYGPAADRSRSSITFVGDVSVDLVDSSGAAIAVDGLRIGRYEADDLGVRIAWDQSTSPVGPEALDVAVTLETPSGLAQLSPSAGSDSPPTFVIVADDLERQLQGGGLKAASSVDLVVRPSAVVDGIRLASGDPVTIDFGTFVFKAGISNGAGYPSFVGLDPASGIEFEGVATRTLTMRFRGPDSGDGVVKYGEFVEPASDVDASKKGINIDVVGATRECVTPQQQVVTCTVELKPDEEAILRFDGQLGVTFVASESVQKSVEGVVDVPVTMYRRPRPWIGWLAAGTLLALFIIVQGFVRLGLAVLLSKFSALAPTARRVRLSATVDQAGSVSPQAPMGEMPSGDDGFAFENAESVQAFDLFGYRFECPVRRTFFGSTTVPMGLVSAPGVHVIGSQGYQSPKRGAGAAAGQVALSLRGQWIVGVKEADAASLVAGVGPVPAEIVAFLEPYESAGTNRSQQISDLTYTIASSSFSTQLASLLDAVRESGTGVGEGGFDSEPGTPASTPAPDDDGVFGTASASAAAPDASTSHPTNEWDPFA